MDYLKKLTIDRPRASTKPDRGLEVEYESNRGRIMHSAAFRRLQKKAQVFSFESNAAVRSRMTHSLEVMQAGRYIARCITKEIIDRNPENEQYDYAFRTAFITAIEMACLLHDIGNPPFGHFGEAAINEWMKNNIGKLYSEADKENSGDMSFQEKLFDDLKNFEGNAQAIRNIHSLQGLNLTFTQIASVLKYTRCANERSNNISADFSYLTKKPGFYFSENDLICSIRESLNIDKYCRHPFAYIMEAADDISYCVSDLEDAVEKGIVTFSIIQEELKNAFPKKSEEQKIVEILLSIKESESDYDKSVSFRVNLAEKFVPAVVSNFLKNEQNIYDGNYNHPLLDEKTTPEGAVLEQLKKIMRKHVFNNRGVETREIKGYSVIRGLLDIFSPILELHHDNFNSILTDNIKGYDIQKRLISRLPTKYKDVYSSSTQSLDKADKNYKAHEWYYRVRLLIDFISGMTDDFALKEYQDLSGIGFIN